MKVCIFGAGAIGGLIGARLAAAGSCEVSAVARGATLAALRRDGWRLRSLGKLVASPAHAAEHAAEIGPQDLVIVAVKTTAMAAVAREIAPLLGPGTIVLPAMNGVPWWFCRSLTGAASGMQLQSIDPDGSIEAAIPGHRVLGCVVHASASVSEPGLVEHRMGNGLIIGEPSGTGSARAASLQKLFSAAGFDVTVSQRIHYDIWYKLWGNMTMNPVSAITGATADRILDDDLVRSFCSSAMQEAAAIGALIGCEITQTAEERHAVTRKLGAFKTSMLQDVEAARTLELDALVAAVREIGARVGVATPNIDALFGIARLFARTRGLYPDSAF